MSDDIKLINWVEHIMKYRFPIASQLEKYIKLHGEGAEIGAGTCWLSATLSKNENIKKIIAVEIDEKRLQLARSFFLSHFEGNEKKIEFVCGDFHLLPFADASLDFVVCDAALHHSEKLEVLLSEIRRVLKDNGAIVAMREPVLPSLLFLKTWRKTFFGWKQRLHGDVEKTYTKSQWLQYFSNAGFDLELFPIFLGTTIKEKIAYKLRRFNGILFGRFIFIAKVK